MPRTLPTFQSRLLVHFGLRALYGMSLAMATAGFTAYMLASAAGMALGGFLTSKAARPDRTVAISLIGSGSIDGCESPGVGFHLHWRVPDTGDSDSGRGRNQYGEKGGEDAGCLNCVQFPEAIANAVGFLSAPDSLTIEHRDVVH